MTNNKSFLADFEISIKENWDLSALTDIRGTTYYYKDLAEQVAKLHLIFKETGIEKGDKIALIGKNQSAWGIVFMATISYGAVIVPILSDFKDENLKNIIEHSESKALFVGSDNWAKLFETDKYNLELIARVSDYSVISSKKPELVEYAQNINENFQKAYINGFSRSDVKYHKDEQKELAVISYTSGTTGFSKGVMLPFVSLWSNVNFARQALPELKPGATIVSLLPMAHMYGLMFEFIFQILNGSHVYFLTKMPTPNVVMEALAEVKPKLVIAVPLIIEKIYKRQILPIINKPVMKFLLKIPGVRNVIYGKIRDKLTTAFGGNFFEVIVGGAALNPDIEKFFKKIKFKYTVGYGMTECCPIISYADWSVSKLYSCGQCVPRMEIVIDSPDPNNVVGEILVKGDNVMLGYYKNPTETDLTLKDGWMHTGDLGILDKDGFLFIKGRSKNMFLGASGQNIYPEEIENLLNNLPYVVESIALERNGKIIALVHPDYDTIDKEKLVEIMEQNKKDINKVLPKYSQVAEIEIYEEEFEKTPKKSIKRFLYK